jgi:hypothetical protein
VVITLCAGVWNQELESICALSAQKKLVSLLYVVSDINQTKTGFFQHLKIKKIRAHNIIDRAVTS